MSKLIAFSTFHNGKFEIIFNTHKKYGSHTTDKEKHEPRKKKQLIVRWKMKA